MDKVAARAWAPWELSCCLGGWSCPQQHKLSCNIVPCLQKQAEAAKMEALEKQRAEVGRDLAIYTWPWSLHANISKA